MQLQKRGRSLRKRGIDFVDSEAIFFRVTKTILDLSDNPEVPPEMFAKAIVRRGLATASPKEQVTLRLDVDVLNWFRSQGKGYQTKINALLRTYMEAHRGK